MADGCADLRADGVQNDLAHDEEEDAKGDVAQRPAVLQSPDDKEDLECDVDEKLNGVQQVQDDEETDGVGGSQTNPRLEGSKRNQEAYRKSRQRTNAQQPDGKKGAVFVQLKSDETVDQQASDQGRRQAVLHRYEVRVRGRARRNDTCINAKGDETEEHVNVKEHEDFLATCEWHVSNAYLAQRCGAVLRVQLTNSREFAADVQDHDDGHEEGDDVHGAGGTFKNDGVCQLDIAGIAVRLDTNTAGNLRDGTDGCTQWQWRHVADVGEVAKA